MNGGLRRSSRKSGYRDRATPLTDDARRSSAAMASDAPNPLCHLPHFVTGEYTRNKTFLGDDEYGRALDCFVKGCADRLTTTADDADGQGSSTPSLTGGCWAGG